MVTAWLRSFRKRILPFFQPRWKRRLFVCGYICLLNIVVMYSMKKQFTRDILIGITLSFLCYIITKGIITVILYQETMERELPIVNSKYLLPPGRYINLFHVLVIERHDSPVNDYDHFCLFTLVFGLLMYLPLYQNAAAQNLNEVLWCVAGQVLFLSVFLTLLLKMPEIKAMYEENMAKAKVIFMECNGDREKLKQSEAYYRYQVDRKRENTWYAEIKARKEETIRLYQRTDLAEILTLYYETIHAVNAKDYTPEQLDAWADGHAREALWDAHLQEHTTLVYISHGKLLGFADMDERGYFDHLFVHKDHQHEGIATKLCDALERQSKAAVFTTHASMTAKPFFLQRGYALVKEQQVERKGVLLTNYIMKKQNSSQ